MDKESLFIKSLAILFFTIVIGLAAGAGAGIFYGLNHYWLWSARMTGEQELARAEGNRQIAILEANAKRDSAKALAEAEIIRAEGVAKANIIIGQSLKDNEGYLRYLWVNNIEHTQNQVIYVPTETSLPILEAKRLQK